MLTVMYMDYFFSWIPSGIRFQEFNQEGERDMLLTEVSHLRNQVGRTMPCLTCISISGFMFN